MMRGIHATLSTGLVAVLLGACPAWGQTIIRVSTTGDDVNDGSDWPVAKRTIQAALNAAVSGGGEVWVKAGTYPGRITLRAGVHVYGGFSGSETARDQRDFRANATILDGQQSGPVVWVQSVSSGLSTIDGFTIRNGRGIFGGGIFCDRSSPTIANNTITRNMAPPSWGGDGGGIYCSSSSPVIVNNTIAENIASSDGGGIYCVSSSPVIVNNTVVGNTASNGGGVYCVSSSPMIVNTIVAFNSSGVYRESSGGGTPALRHNCVFGNTAYGYSGVTDPTGTDGNISTDPELVRWQYGNWHVQADSPCVNTGDDGVVQAGWVDIDGQPRIQGPHVDIGVDESDGTVWPLGVYVVVRVRLDGDDANDGSSWSLAKRTIQSAIDAASVAGGEVWVKAGAYFERITLHPYVYVYGGFSGSEAARDERDFRANVTILDGQQGGSVVAAWAGHGVSAIDGFTIRNGTGTISGENPLGGGIYCSYSSPAIANNTITANTASYGGGVACVFSSPTITNSTITGNNATGWPSSGGGIYCADSSPLITDNTISGNSTSGSIDGGGGAVCILRGSPTIANNTVTRNSASSSGAGLYCVRASATIANNVIVANTAVFDGGGIACAYEPLVIVGNTITANTSAYGGGIHCYQCSATVMNTVVAFNSSGILQKGTGTPTLKWNCVYANAAYDYSGTTDPTGTNGNISVDPLFVDSTADDYHLKPVSPCINAGDPGGDYAGQTDADDEPRVAYGRVDIGADEFLYRGSLDFDLDNDLDLADFGFFAACFAGPNRPYPDVAICSQADLDADNDVDLTNFAAFRSCFNGPNRPPACS